MSELYQKSWLIVYAVFIKAHRVTKYSSKRTDYLLRLILLKY